MAPNTAALALALFATSSMALPFNFPFWSHPDQGSGRPGHHPPGSPQGRPHHGNPGEDHPFHYSAVGPWGHPTEPTGLPTSSETTSQPTEAAPTFPIVTGLPYPSDPGFTFPTAPAYYPTGFPFPTGTGFPYPTGTGFAHPTGSGYPFPTGVPFHGPPYGLIPPPDYAPIGKRFEGPRRNHGGQQWQPYHGPWGEGEQHGHPHGPPHGFEPPTPTAGGVASTGFAMPSGVFPTGVFPTGGFAVPTGFAWPTERPSWGGDGGYGPPHGGFGGHGHGERE